ncbi:FAD-dependent monooxygenase [Amycolatopsis pithecellobii]|uniref:FAD-dependent monooxygenase n=1 Tax=Amycolatopsis pithecellobii TaxID=664692 RepID=UPI001AA03D8F|nr:FAD-dependent monooxygenase [Amycolatopsis pithecellobii]
MKSPDIDALIVGAGPVGLSTALQLGRAGVRTLLVERHAGLAHHPKAVGVHARTMELFRQWGIAENARAVGLPLERTLAVAWLTRLTGIELGTLHFAEDAEKMAEFAGQSPEAPLFAPQDRIEPILLDAARHAPSVEIRMSTTVSAIEQDEGGATVVLEPASGSPVTVRARYVIAADGARSRTRERHEFGEVADQPYGESVNVYFRADLDEITAGRPYLLWWIVNPDVQGAFWPVDTEGRWIFNFEGDPDRPDDHFGKDLCTRLIREAAGAPDLDIELLNVLRWRHEQAVARRWRRGRILLVGDAAHRFPPHGGFGMNSGIQDSANLAWKIAAVVRGEAGEELLDTYEAERKPVAEYNSRQVMLNTERMQDTGWLTSDPSVLSDIELPSGEQARRRFAEAIPAQREQIHSQGQQFGRIYTSRAVVPDGTTAVESGVERYHPTSHPGARLPHVWLTGGAGRLSTVDLTGHGFVLLSRGPGTGWATAAKQVSARLNVPIEAYELGEGGDLCPDDPRDLEVLEIPPAGAVLVRPDSHVGYRALGEPDDPVGELAAAMRTILHRS